jgi:hypothetical protein
VLVNDTSFPAEIEMGNREFIDVVGDFALAFCRANTQCWDLLHSGVAVLIPVPVPDTQGLGIFCALQLEQRKDI